MTLSVEKIDIIKNYLLKATSKKVIAETLNVSLRTIYSVASGARGFNPPRNSTSKKYKINNEIKKAIVSLEKGHKKVTSVAIGNILSNNVSTRTIRRRMCSMGLSYRRRCQRIQLSDNQKAKRVEIVRSWIIENVDFDKVVFSDECRFSLDGNDNFMSWSKDNNTQRARRPFGGGSIMIWGCISRDGPLLVRRVEGTINSNSYCDMLKDDIFPLLKNEIDSFLFQQDNAHAHTSKKTIEMLTAEKVDILPWPAHSPDLSPIEKVWSIIKQRLYNGPQFDGKESLWSGICHEVDKINDEEFGILSNLYRHFKENMCLLLKNDGALLR